MQIPTSSTVWWAPVCRSPVALHVEVEPAVAGQQVEHVVEEADAGLALAARRRRRASASTWTSVSPVLRSISAARLISLPIVADAGLHRLGVELEALRAGERRRGAGELGGVRSIRTSVKPAAEVRGDSAEAKRAAPLVGSDVVRAGDVVAERGPGGGADEHAAGAGDPRRQRLGACGRPAAGARARTPRRARARGRASETCTSRHDRARVSAQAADPRAASRVEQLAGAARRRPPASRRRARPGPAGRAPAARIAIAGRRSPAGRSGRRTPSIPTWPNTWRLASWTYRLPGPTITSTGAHRLGPVRERGDRLGTAHAVDLEAPVSRQAPRIDRVDLAVTAGRRAHGDLLDAGHAGRDDAHHDRARVRRPAAGHVHAPRVAPGPRGASPRDRRSRPLIGASATPARPARHCDRQLEPGATCGVEAARGAVASSASRHPQRRRRRRRRCRTARVLAHGRRRPRREPRR